MAPTIQIRKNFYREHPRVEQRDWDDIERFLNLHQIKFSGFDMPKPIFSLDEINYPDYIADELKMQGINRPTAIQSLAWPVLYSGRDLMCIGLPTNSRVVSYMCPALVHIKQQEPELRRKGPLVLIVTQTKEVAKEIMTHSQMFMHQAQCTFCTLFDDENINTQSLQIRDSDPDIIIGNYHRLCELLDLGLLNLKNVSFLIMDDFYRNRSARLSDDIKRVVNETRADRQTAIYSRIVPSGLQKSNGDEFQNDPIFICIGNDDIHVVHKDLPQTIHICTMAEKKKKLQDIISEISEQEKNFKILVYANGFKKIRITEKIVKELGIDTFAYERTNVGRRRRAMKEKVYYNFNATPKSVLVASDVVSSKVDLPELTYIINADFPINLSLYLNRMRSGIKRYISIFIAEDARHADRLIYVLNECRQEVPTILYKISEAYTNSGKDVDRMPSLQEIADGLTKPVEKPIPKPLPPTVHLNTNNITTAKRPLEEKMKQLQPLKSTENGSSSSAASSLKNYPITKKLKRPSITSNGYGSPMGLSSPSPSPVPPVYSPYYQPPPAPSPYYPYGGASPYLPSYPPSPYPSAYPPNGGYMPFDPSGMQVKMEPMAYEQNYPQHYPMHEQQQPQQASYFTNPVPFKQEPIDNSYDQSQQASSSSGVASGSSSVAAQEPASIVSHLLKDQQVLNLLEKVKQTFRQPSQSTYQGSWNFHQ